MHNQQIKRHVREKEQHIFGSMKSFSSVFLFTMVASLLLIFYVKNLPASQFSKGLKQPIDHTSVVWSSNQGNATALVTRKNATPDSQNMLPASTFSYPIEEESFEAGDAIHAQLQQDISALSKKNAPTSFQGYTQVSAFDVIASQLTQSLGLDKNLIKLLVMSNILAGIMILASLRNNGQNKETMTITIFLGLNVTLLNIMALIGFLIQNA